MNRARLLLDAVRTVRAEVSPGFAVAVKLDSADFQRGGFDTDDAQVVIAMLAGAGVDLVERSGGSIESLATAGAPADGRTLAREAYFLELSQRLVADAPVPLMLTGGVRRRAVAQHVLNSGFAVVGLATALAIDPDLPRKWLAGSDDQAHPPRTRLQDKVLAAAAGPGRHVAPARSPESRRAGRPTARPFARPAARAPAQVAAAPRTPGLEHPAA